MSQSFRREAAGGAGGGLQLGGGRAGRQARGSQAESGLGPLQGTNGEVGRSTQPLVFFQFCRHFLLYKGAVDTQPWSSPLCRGLSQAPAPPSSGAQVWAP